MLQKKLDGLVGAEFHSKTQGGHKVEVRLNDQVVFTKLDLLIEFYLSLVSEANLINHASFNLLVLVRVQSKAGCDLLGEV